MGQRIVEIVTKKTIIACDIKDCDNEADAKCAVCHKELCKIHQKSPFNYCREIGEDIAGLLCPRCYQDLRQFFDRIIIAKNDFSDFVSTQLEMYKQVCWGRND